MLKSIDVGEVVEDRNGYTYKVVYILDNAIAVEPINNDNREYLTWFTREKILKMKYGKEVKHYENN